MGSGLGLARNIFSVLVGGWGLGSGAGAGLGFARKGPFSGARVGFWFRFGFRFGLKVWVEESFFVELGGGSGSSSDSGLARND